MFWFVVVAIVPGFSYSVMLLIQESLSRDDSSVDGFPGDHLRPAPYSRSSSEVYRQDLDRVSSEKEDPSEEVQSAEVERVVDPVVDLVKMVVADPVKVIAAERVVVVARSGVVLIDQMEPSEARVLRVME